MEQYRQALAADGVELHTFPLFDADWFAILEQPASPLRSLRKAAYSLRRLFARLRQLRAAKRSGADLIHVEQQLFPYLPAWIEAALWPRDTPTLLEFDDAIYLTFAHRKKLQRLCALADGVIVGNDTLADFARPWAQHVHVIPTTLDLSRYAAALDMQRARRAEHAQTGPLRVAWIGLRYNFAYLAELAAPLAELCRAHPGSELVVISSALPDAALFPGVPLELEPWSEHAEAEALARCDVCVMPLPDTEWARGKCALKLLQGMAAGLPVIASPVGVNTHIIESGRNGLLASAPSDWSEALLALAADPELRTRLGEAGRERVEAEFTLEGGARQLHSAYRQTLSGAAKGVSQPVSPPGAKRTPPA
ncbi:MAG: glycosyl transferase [Planctomycetota bacterium]|nr:MAG: glycosyl transferase [Planctomycetota bacterium]